MLNPRPALPFLITELNSVVPASISFRTMRIFGNRVTFTGGKGGPASQLNLWQTGRRTLRVYEFAGPAYVKATWTMTNAYPCKWELSEFDASKSEVAIETLEIAHEGLS